MTKLAQRHSVWTSYWASYPALRMIVCHGCSVMYDEIKNVMGISSWINGFLVVSIAATKMPLQWEGGPAEAEEVGATMGSSSSTGMLATPWWGRRRKLDEESRGWG
jgi:hypothetical protein